jgi:ubiquinone biosynthesis protein
VSRSSFRRADSPERRARQREVERVLALHGLLRGPREVAGGSPPLAPGAAGFAARLREALGQLGPAFSVFGLDLASRVDLLPAEDCLELAATPDGPEAGSAAAPAEPALGRPLGELFASVEAEPRAAWGFVQEHGARLADGRAVVLRVLRPGVEEALERDLPLLPLLGRAFADSGRGGFPLDDAVAGFRESLTQALDLSFQAEGLAALAEEAEASGVIRAPSVVEGLAGTRAVVLEDLGGRPLLEAAAAETGRARDELARRLCLGWLRQALLGRAFPVAPRGMDLRWLADGRIAFTGGPFARPPGASQENLGRWLLAASAHDPDEACARLLRETIREGPPGSEERLRLRLRQAVPFRDGGWSAAGQGLAEDLFLHARFARECGYRPRGHLLAFQRGLFWIASAARELAPERDAFAEALEDFRLLASLDRVGEAARFDALGPNLERYAALMADLPEKLDAVLSRAAAGGLREPAPAPGARSGEGGFPASFAAVLLALGAVVLLARQLGGEGWVEQAAPAVFFGLGVLLLRWAGRP